MPNTRLTQALKRSVDEERHVIEFYASTDWHAPDDLVVDPEAWRSDMDTFMLNPTVTLFHNYHDFAAGRVVAWKIDKKGLIVSIEFAVDDNPKARQAWDLYRKGFMNAVSVGFYIMQSERRKTDDEDPKEYLFVTQARLLEVALVPVPMDAFALAIRSGAYKGPQEDLLALLPDARDAEPFTSTQMVLLHSMMAGYFTRSLPDEDDVDPETEARVLRSLIKKMGVPGDKPGDYIVSVAATVETPSPEPEPKLATTPDTMTRREFLAILHPSAKAVDIDSKVQRNLDELAGSVHLTAEEVYEALTEEATDAPGHE